MQVTSLLSATALAVPLFATTNVDDIFVLVGFFGDPRFRTREIVVGQYLGIGTLALISVAAAVIALAIPNRYIGLLGLAPIAVGLKKLIDLRHEAASAADLERHTSPVSSASRVLAVTTITTANGGDNVSAYAPVFATHSSAEIAIIVSAFAVMTAIWCLLAHWFVSHRALGAPIRRYGHGLLPFVLIALGLIILERTGTFALLE